MLATNFSYGIEKDEEKLKANDLDHTKWTNPLESRLPNAPSMKFFCVYGHGKDTEVSDPAREQNAVLTMSSSLSVHTGMMYRESGGLSFPDRDT